MGLYRLISFDRLELLEVWLGSGKVYLAPGALLENLVQALPVSAVQLIVSETPRGGPLDPLASYWYQQKVSGPTGI